MAYTKEIHIKPADLSDLTITTDFGTYTIADFAVVDGWLTGDVKYNNASATASISSTGYVSQSIEAGDLPEYLYLLPDNEVEILSDGNTDYPISDKTARMILEDKADKSEIPTATSELVNDSGYLTSADISNMVTTDTAQSISGAKSFTSGLNVTALNPYSSISTGTKGTAPSGNLESRFRYYDSAGSASNANCLGGMRITYYSDGKIATQLQAYKPEAASTVFESIQVIYPASGDPYTYAPASDVVDSIVTTTYIYKNSGNIRVSHGNGLKIVTAAANNITGSSEYTWNYGVTFSDTPKIFVTRRSNATTTTSVNIWVRGTPGTSSCKIYNDGNSGNTYTWHLLAIGY